MKHILLRVWMLWMRGYTLVRGAHIACIAVLLLIFLLLLSVLEVAVLVRLNGSALLSWSRTMWSPI